MIIAARFNGPDGSGNGGYACGLIAQLLGGGPAEVTLMAPPPLETALSVEHRSATIQVYADGKLIAEALPVAPPESPVPPVSLAAAAEASRSYPGFTEHAFPACYVCGPQRPPGDGLRVFPGLLPDGRTAAPFTAPGDVSAVTVWAALDCPGGWAAIAPERKPFVLGRMAASVTAVPRPGQQCVAVGRLDRLDGRKALVSSSLYGPDGELIGTARATWIAIAPPQ